MLAARDARPRRQAAESAALRFFAWDELPPLALDPGLRRALAKARARLGLGA